MTAHDRTEMPQVGLQLPLLCRLMSPGPLQRAGGTGLCAVPLHREAEAQAEKMSVDHLCSPEQQVPHWEQ